MKLVFANILFIVVTILSSCESNEQIEMSYVGYTVVSDEMTISKACNILKDTTGETEDAIEKANELINEIIDDMYDDFYIAFDDSVRIIKMYAEISSDVVDNSFKRLSEEELEDNDRSMNKMFNQYYSQINQITEIEKNLSSLPEMKKLKDKIHQFKKFESRWSEFYRKQHYVLTCVKNENRYGK